MTLRDRIEPDIRPPSASAMDPTTYDAEWSRTISLKRIADSMERIADALHDPKSGYSALRALDVLASAAEAGRS